MDCFLFPLLFKLVHFTILVIYLDCSRNDLVSSQNVISNGFFPHGVIQNYRATNVESGQISGRSR